MLVALAFLVTVCLSTARASVLTCTLTHSASAGVEAGGRVDVHTSTSDHIVATLSEVGAREARVKIAGDDPTWPLVLLRDERDAIYYNQPTASGQITWVYFKRSRSVTYSKLRAFPVTGEPSSYLMVGLCQ